MPLANSPDQPVPLRVVLTEVKKWVERLGAIWTEGQVVEVKRRQTSLHFLTLRDRLSDTSASVTITTQALEAAGPLVPGTTVAALLQPGVWLTSGRLVFGCSELRQVGQGRLLQQLEQLKQQLRAEGLFDPALKRRLPFLPRRIGLVTGAGSAAERDVTTTVHDRWPAAVFTIRHAQVQGPQAAGQVMAALGELDALPDVDVIVIARGGGSFEDLLPFSDEGLVRAVAKCHTPVVSAIGHEVDTPLLDHVADLRASTPTAAAKVIVPDVAEELDRVRTTVARARRAVTGMIRENETRLASLRARPVLRAPTGVLDLQAERLEALRSRLARAAKSDLERRATDLAHIRGRVRALSPQGTLARGYAILLDADRNTISAVSQTEPDAAIHALVADGELDLIVRSTRPRRRHD